MEIKSKSFKAVLKKLSKAYDKRTLPPAILRLNEKDLALYKEFMGHTGSSLPLTYRGVEVIAQKGFI